jgi:hypothetical protein
MATDADGDMIYYLWDWGDGNFSEWLGPFASNLTATAQHSWSVKGTYSIRVKAKDVYDTESNWSEPLAVTMPRSMLSVPVFFEKLLQRFPLLLLFLQEFFSRFSE